ncbi:hypothetical protein HQ585_11660 [candidate division KSB1 bacterium]|nr:hypothetical protein [candidate division KSB1 bacterium]
MLKTKPDAIALMSHVQEKGNAVNVWSIIREWASSQLAIFQIILKKLMIDPFGDLSRSRNENSGCFVKSSGYHKCNGPQINTDEAKIARND